MNFWPTHFRSRFSLCSLWSVIFLCLLCVYCTLLAPHPPPPTTKFCVDYCFQILLGGLYIPKRIGKQFLMQNLRGKKSALWGIRKKSVGRRCVRTRCTSSSLFSSTESCCHGIFLAAYSRELWSRKYLLRTCIRETELWLKGCISFACYISFSSAKSAFSVWPTVTPSAGRSLSKCRPRGFKMQTLNSVHYLTNLRSTLLVTSRISCYEVAWSRHSESRAAEKIK